MTTPDTNAAAKTCGNMDDRFPCIRCGATVPKVCPAYAGPSDDELAARSQIHLRGGGSIPALTDDEFAEVEAFATTQSDALAVIEADRHLFKMIVTRMVGPTKRNAIDGDGFDQDARMQYIAAHRIASATTAENLEADLKVARELIERAHNELRFIRAKDTGAVYDIGLRTDLSAALSSIAGAKGS